MSAYASVLTVGGWVALSACGYAALADDGRREWARGVAKQWTRRLGALAGALVAVAAGLFSLWPPGGVYVMFAAGVFAYAGGVLAAMGAAGLADAAVGEAASLSRRIQAFWFAAAADYRASRAAFALAFLAFGLAAIVAGVTVDPVVAAVGSVAFGGAVASLTGLAAVGAFVPGGYDGPVADAVRAAR